jgi:hypothetical protein
MKRSRLVWRTRRAGERRGDEDDEEELKSVEGRWRDGIDG